MSKKSVSLAAAAVTLAIGTAGLWTTAASAAEPEVVCEFWASGDTYNVLTTKTSEREFRVAITDLKSLAGEHTSEDRFIPLPLDPNLRMSSNVVTVNPRLAVSNATISQSIVTGPSEDAPFVAIESFNRLPSAPWESVELDGNKIFWEQDMDARSDEEGVQVLPSTYFFPGLAIDDAAGVLEFTVTIPDDVEGEVYLFDDMTADFMSSKIEPISGVWTPDQPLSQTVPGCKITIEAVTDGGPDGETDEPDGETDGPDGETDGSGGETGGPDGETGGTDTSAEDVTKTPVAPKPAEPAAQKNQIAETGGSSFAPWAAGAAGATLLGGAIAIAAQRKLRTK